LITPKPAIQRPLAASGKSVALRAFLNHTRPENLVLRLFSNDVTPSAGDSAAKYSEATFSGYGPITLSGFAWQFTDGEQPEATYSEQTFRSSLDQSPQNVYGWYLTQEQSGHFVAAGRFNDAPNPISNLSDQIKVTPRVIGV
jgi:hypothetical protein